MPSYAVLLLAAAGLWTAAQAADEGPWSGGAAAGYLASSGNSENKSASFQGEVRYDADRWHHRLGASATLASQNDESTSEAYTADGQSKYDFAKRYYLFGSVDWLSDRFSAYSYQVYESAGLGWHAILPPAHRLDLEAGPGFRQAKLRDDQSTPLVDESDSRNELIGIARLEYEWTISEHASFTEKASMIAGSDNTLYESISAVKAGLIGNVSLVLGYVVRHNTDVLGGFDKTDTQTTVALEYGFGKKKPAPGRPSP